MPQDPASFRDPAGHVHVREGRVFRSVLPAGVAHYRAVRESGFFDRASSEGLLIEGREGDPAVLQHVEPSALHVIEHPHLDFISHPYEWSFFGLRAAATLTLDLHILALQHGMTMTDASAYNVQFVGPRPVFIDYLSFIPYEDGQAWLGYRQFCQQFLNPLLLTVTTGVAFQPWYRGAFEGISSSDLARVLPFRSMFSPRVALHVKLQGRLERNVTAKREAAARSVRLSKTAVRNNLRSMREWIATLKPPGAQRTPWQQYEMTAQYTPGERLSKAQFVREVIAAERPGTVWDLGCNAGEYSEIALEAGAGSVIGFEPDPGALSAAFRRAVSKQLRFLPLFLDVANPSPSLGWRQQERPGFAERRNADLVLCLALLHHLVLGRNLPLIQVLDWLMSIAPSGIVEFVPKEDPMARQLLALKPDIFPDYTRENVTALIKERARIVREEVVTESGRVLFAFAPP